MSLLGWEPEAAPAALGQHQEAFDAVIDKYASGLEPLENWAEEDLERLQAAIEAELRERHPTEEANGNR